MHRDQYQAPVGVTRVNTRKSRLRPRQITSPLGIGLGLAVVVLVVAAVIYSVLVATRTVPIPSILLIGDTRVAGQLLAGSTDFQKAKEVEASQFSDPESETLAAYLSFRSDVLAALDPTLESYQKLSVQMMKDGIPRLRAIKDGAQDAQAKTQASRAALSELAIPDAMGEDNTAALDKMLNAAQEYLKFGDQYLKEVQRGVSGYPASFGDAANTASNMTRYRAVILSQFKKVEASFGWTDPAAVAETEQEQEQSE